MNDKTDKPARKPQRALGPRPAYVLVKLPEGITAADVEVVESTRKAEEALEAIDTGKATGYVRIMLK